MSIRAFRHICPGAIFAVWVTLFSSGMHYKYLFKILKQHVTLLRIEWKKMLKVSFRYNE